MKRTIANPNLRYVQVYSTIYKRIVNSQYPQGSQLPPEKALADELNISRSTLRQALSLLKDDKMIQGAPGKGNFVLYDNSTLNQAITQLRNPIYAGLAQSPTDIELDAHLESSTKYTNHILKRPTGMVMFISRWYKEHDTAMAFAFSTLPVDTLDRANIDGNNQDELRDYLENTVYQNQNYAKRTIQFSRSGNESAKPYQLSTSDNFILVQETIYSRELDYPLCHTKYYFPAETCTLKLTAE
ncbi:GntR family transcriptional regulator [Levilactobacillus huananensis]|uniref:GntR family transcriptional regulator n=1 Tax=Levilactobacillus huananensis TaxID=2486019 RepID=UPI000F768357|nr:GntR family transcriptional regulator [Levilactobacillus huananensis]